MEFTTMDSVWHITFYNYRFRGYTNQLCLDAALGYWGLSSFDWVENLVIFKEAPNLVGDIWDDEFRTVFVKNLDETECTRINEYFTVTNPERTICDMITYEQHEFHLCEALDMVYNWHDKSIVNIEKLEQMAKQRGIYEELQRLKIVAAEQAEEG